MRNLLRSLKYGLLMISLLAVPACAPPPQPVTIGIVSLIPEMEDVVTGFKANMEKLGYHEGTTVLYSYAGATGSVEGLAPAAQALAEAQVDLILSITTPGSQAVQNAISTTAIPQVFVAVTDPVAAKLVPSLTAPGGRITGVLAGAKAAVSEGRRLEWLLKIVPNVKKLAMIYNPDDPVGATGFQVVQDAAQPLGVEVIGVAIHAVEEAPVIAAQIPPDIDAIYLSSDRIVGLTTQVFIDAALQNYWPLTISNPKGAENGALLAYGPDFTTMGQQAARLADQLLKGAAPANLPVEVPELLLVINLKTAQTIHLDIADELLNQAHHVIR